jgi:hypothetical protein
MASSTSAAPKRPRKRRKTKAGLTLYEDDDDAADAFFVRTRIVETRTGPVEETYEVPMWPVPLGGDEEEDQAAPLRASAPFNMPARDPPFPDPDAFHMPDQDPYLAFDEGEPEALNTAKV